jgi:hypothetical protein
MLTTPRIIKHAEVTGEQTHSHACQGTLACAYEFKLRDFFTSLSKTIPASPYGKNREAWLIGEAGTVGDYEFSSFKVKRHTYTSWIWDLGRQLYEQTGHPLDADQFLVAFIPHYFDGGFCGLHQDKEPNMRDDWIVSVSLGSPVQFQFGPTKDSLDTTHLASLSVLGMSRWLWHSVPPIKGERWNITFRCWKSEPDYRRLMCDFSVPAESKVNVTTKPGNKHGQCRLCEKILPITDTYVAHLTEDHKVLPTKGNLIPFDLGQCPYCGKYFAASRGWSNHTQRCRQSPLASDENLPRPCWVWWQKEQKFFKAQALALRPGRPPSYTVHYDDEETDFIELAQLVVFSDPSAKVPDTIPATEDAAAPHEDIESDLEEGEILPTPEIKEATVSPTTPDDLLPDWFSKKSCIPAEITSDKPALTAILVEIHQAAASLRRLPPLRLWRGNQRRTWARCTRQFVKYFQSSLRKDSNSEDFLKLCLRLLELPSIILTQTMPAPKPPSEARASLPFKLKKAESLAFQDRLHEATKILFSHGVTPPSEDVFTRLQKLHPPLKEEIPVIEAHDEQFSITPGQTVQALYRHSGETWKSLDPFGWSTALLHLIRAYKPEEGPSFFDLTAEFIAKLANCQVPDSVAFIFTTGSLLALNKDPENIRRKRLEDGLKPRERPINQGTMFLKIAFDLALRSKAAQKAAESLLPIQQGLGSKRGMELISHACSAFYKEGYAILKKDATNGFQEISRAKMHRAVERRCPSLLRLFQKYYHDESIGLYNTGEAVKVVKIEEGCRMGCKLSSFGFDLTVHDAYLGVKEQLERTATDKSTDHSFLKAATDDVLIAIKADPANPMSLYKRVRGLCIKLDFEAERVGLSFENDKATLLLPPGWAPPDDRTQLPPPGLLEIRSDTIEDVHSQGMEVVGCPIGSVRYCKNFVQNNLKSMLRNTDDLVQIHPQAASKIILNCVAPAPAYLSQVCHPQVTNKSLFRFDQALWRLWVSMLGGIGSESEQLAMCTEGTWRSRSWAYLPTRLGGAGLRCWSSISHYAWFSSVASCSALQDVDFERGRVFLKTECEGAHAIALDALGGVTYVNHAKFEFMPPEESDVLYASDYYKDWFKDYDFTKLQKEFSDFVAEELLKDLSSHQKLKEPHVTKSEVIRSLHTRKRPGSSVLTQLFTAQLSDREARLTKTEFTISARQFLGLPALKIPRGELVELKCGCEAQQCPNAECAGTIMDPFGNHAITCHGGIAARKATLLEYALERAFRKAGGKPDRQPPTTRLLGDVVPKQDLAALFAGGLNKEQTTRNSELALELVDAFTLPPGALQESVIAEVRSRLPAVDDEKKESQNTIRFDLCLGAPFPIDAPRQLWLDHVIVQETATSYQDDVVAYLEGSDNPTKSPAFRRMETAKQRRFRALITIAKHLQKQRLIDFQPFFLFPVVSSLGFLNDDAETMMKWMSTVLNKCIVKTRDDGVPFGVIKARYKTEVRNAVCFGLVRGNALAMHSAGRPFVSRPL